MKYKVELLTNKTTKQGKPYKETTIKAEGGESTKVNIFSEWPDFANVAPGAEIEGTLEKNGNYWNLKSDLIKERKPNMDRIMDKKVASIAEAQATKAKSIADAQDRSSWMWAKNNACMLIAHNPDLNKGNIDKNLIISLATSIYNAEPLLPF